MAGALAEIAHLSPGLHNAGAIFSIRSHPQNGTSYNNLLAVQRSVSPAPK
jgi:hypothetical protein